MPAYFLDKPVAIQPHDRKTRANVVREMVIISSPPVRHLPQVFNALAIHGDKLLGLLAYLCRYSLLLHASKLQLITDMRKYNRKK